ILMRGGSYRLSQTVVFSLQDSAPEGGTITYAAFPGEKPILTSGVPIRDWTKVRNDPPNLPPAARGRLWSADLPPQLPRALTLYDGFRRLPRARGPGFAPTGFADRKTASASRFTFPPGAL